MLFDLHIGMVIILLIVLLFVVRHERLNRLARLKQAKLIEVWDGAERRRSIRVNASVPIACSAISRSLKKGNGCTRNISTGGLQFISEALYSLNEKIQLEIYLPNQTRIAAVCQVVWVQELTLDNADRRYFSIGLRFEQMKGKHRSLLTSYIESLLAPQTVSSDKTRAS